MHDVKASIPDELRAVMRGIGATITVIAVGDEDTRHCMVATAVMPMSLAPPTLLIAVNADASCHYPIVQRGAFCVNVLGAEHLGLGKGIAQAANRDRFDVGNWSRVSKEDAGSHDDIVGLPYLENVQASVACRVVRTVQHGTHTLFFGEVLWISKTDHVEPLLYCDGAFGRFVGAPTLPRVHPASTV